MSTKENQNAKNSHADGLPYRIPYNSRFQFGSYLWLCSRLSKWRVGRSAVVSRNSSNARQAGRLYDPSVPSSLPCESGDQPSYPGIPPTQGKLEGTLGSYNLRAYGTVLLNVSGSDSAIVGGDVPLWATPSSARPTFL